MLSKYDFCQNSVLHKKLPKNSVIITWNKYIYKHSCKRYLQALLCLPKGEFPCSSHIMLLTERFCILVQRKELVTTDSSGSWSQKSFLTRAVFADVSSAPPALLQCSFAAWGSTKQAFWVAESPAIAPILPIFRQESLLSVPATKLLPFSFSRGEQRLLKKIKRKKERKKPHPHRRQNTTDVQTFFYCIFGAALI